MIALLIDSEVYAIVHAKHKIILGYLESCKYEFQFRMTDINF